MQVQDVNRLMKQYQQMEKMMSKLRTGGMKGLMRQLGGAMRAGGGLVASKDLPLTVSRNSAVCRRRRTTTKRHR